jgi:hypothetical protein
MLTRALPFALLWLVSTPGIHGVQATETPPDQRAADFVAALSQAFEPPAWREALIAPPLRVEQSPGQIYNAGLAPVWKADVTTPQGAQGYLMWEDSPEAPLVDFAWDAPEGRALPKTGKGGLVREVPNQQQFPVPGTAAPEVASGCVPTAGANLIGFWVRHGFSQWAGDARPENRPSDLRAITTRLRSLLAMREIPDKDGFTENGMPLSGAFPADLEAGLQADAAAHGLALETRLERFSIESLRQETAAGRPVLLSCLVRLPQKPHLSWGHEVTGTGWVEVGGRFFAGVRDNFYPSQSGETTRWLGMGQMQSLLRVAPKRAAAGPFRTE